METVLLRRRAAIVPWPPHNPPPTKPSRSDRQRPGGTAGERRRGRRYGADVPTLTGPDFVLTSGAQVAPTCGAVVGEPRRANGARASAAVGAMSFLVLRSRSSRCHRLGVERPPVHATARSNPATLLPAQQTRKGGHHASRRGALPYIRLPAATPQPSPTRPSRQRPINRPPRQPVKGGQSIEKSTPLFPQDPLQKSEKRVKDNPKWRIN